jgi:D-alanyl-D-alanine carboxypeptidase
LANLGRWHRAAAITVGPSASAGGPRVPRLCRNLARLGVALGVAGFAWPAEAQPVGDRPPPEIGRLIAAYPDRLDRIDGNALVWKDGTRMVIDDGRGAKAHEERLAAPDLKDMLAQPYPRGATAEPPPVDFEPGRVRHAAFFDKLYGDCRRGEVTAHLVDVVWLPSKWGKTVRVTRLNGVAEKLAAVSRELDALPARFDAFLFPSAGTYNCRPIAGTNRISAHGHGIAIDIATASADYWRWSGQSTGGPITFRNRIAMEIVAVFEKHGFIWGGRWYRYDTMHFEYRPELMPP